MSLTLAIEISNPSSGTDPSRPVSEVALGRLLPTAIDLLGVEQVEVGSRERDDLLPAIDRLCQRQGIPPAQLERIVVDIGPGGFTGLRIAVAAAAAMSEALSIPVVGIPASEVAARSVKPDGKPFAIALAIKGQSGYLQVFSLSGDPSGEPQTLDQRGLERISLPSGSRLIADGHLPESWRRVAADRGWTLEPLHLSAHALLMASVGKPSHDPALLRPVYAREPEAVTLWKARNAQGRAGP